MFVINKAQREPGFAQKMAGSAVENTPGIAQQFGQIGQQKKQADFIKSITGQDVAGLPQEAQQQILGELAKSEGKKSLLNSLFPQNRESAPGLSGKIGATSNPKLPSADEMSTEQIAALSTVLPEVAKIYQSQKEADRKDKTKKETEYFKLNEPKLMELGQKQFGLELDEARYDRLAELFQNEDQFPPGLMVGLFSKDGEIRPTAFAALSPDAQEAAKLLVDLTSNIKDTYGSRVTNFDLQTYMRKLPTLLNSPEGRQRVLRDLQMMNKVTQMHNKGIMDIFEEHGGTDKIPYSKAQALFEKSHRAELNEFKKEFVSPKGAMAERPDAAKHVGKRIRDKSTGEIFISNGTDWVPSEE